jgi:hypothetical protein
VIQPRQVELDFGWVLPWVIGSDLLDQPAIARTSFIGSNNTVMGRLLASAAGESDSDGHDLDSLLARREPAGESDYNAANCQGEGASYQETIERFAP